VKPGSTCGNGKVDSGEECDAGVSLVNGRYVPNAYGATCCTPNCKFAIGFKCNKAVGQCQRPALCEVTNGVVACVVQGQKGKGTCVKAGGSKKRGPFGHCSPSGNCQ